MKRKVFLCLAAAAALAAADLPYVGKWKANLAKSDFGEATVTFAGSNSGDWQASSEGNTYKFKMDGKDYPDGLGDTVAWKSAGANTWQATWKLNGKTTFTDAIKVDGSTLTIATTGKKANGESMESLTTYQRVSGGPGLAGKWKTKIVKASSPSVLELIPSGSDGLTFKESNLGILCEARLDGKDYPCSGAMLAQGWTIAMNQAGDRALDLLVKKDGKPFYKVRYTAAADGKSLTETGGPIATKENMRVVYDRQ